MIELRASEEVRFAALQTAIAGGKATLRETATNDEVSFLAIQDPNAAPGISPTRLTLRPSEFIAANTELRLRLEPEAIQDLFGIPLASAFEQTFPWQPNADTVVADTTPPEVSHVLLRGTRLEIRFTEPVTAENAETAIQLDGEPRSWTVTEDGEVWTTPTDLADGDHTLSISATPLDLAGLPLAEAFERTFRIEPTHLGLIVYRRPSPSQLPTSATGTALTFQGLDLDSETGLLYVRNRYYDPELGRFITADPMGYPDGPNGYAFGGGDTVNGRDPMGLMECKLLNPLSWMDCLSNKEDVVEKEMPLVVSELLPIFVKLDPRIHSAAWTRVEVELQLSVAKRIFKVQANVHLVWSEIKKVDRAKESLTANEAAALLTAASNQAAGDSTFLGVPIFFVRGTLGDSDSLEGGSALVPRNGPQDRRRAATVNRFWGTSTTSNLATAHELGHTIGGLCDSADLGRHCRMGAPQPSYGGLMYSPSREYAGAQGETLSRAEVLRLRENAAGIGTKNGG